MKKSELRKIIKEELQRIQKKYIFETEQFLLERAWEAKIDLKKPWDDLEVHLEDADDDFQIDEEKEKNPTFKAAYDLFIERLNDAIPDVETKIGPEAKDELVRIIDEFEYSIITLQDFNYYMDELYDLGDEYSIWIGAQM